MKFFFRLFSLITILLFSSCKKETIGRIGDFRLDFATVSELPTGRFYTLDNQTELYPSSIIKSDFKTGSRILIQYNITEAKSKNSYSISIISESKINTSTIKPLTSNTTDDPLKLESIWQRGDWLNFRISYEYFDKEHGIALLQNLYPTNDTIYLELRHSKNGDTPGYWVNTLMSYSLKPFAKTTSVPIKVRVNTANEGIKFFTFDYLSPVLN